MKKVTKAIIPVAGYGTRFLPFTKAVPKAMLPVVNVPAVQLVIEEAVASGIESVYLVIGQHKQIIEAHFSKAEQLEKVLTERDYRDLLQKTVKPEHLASITYVEQKEQLGTGHAICSCEQFFDPDEPFAIMFGDDVMSSQTPVLKQLIDVFEKEQKTVIGVKRVGLDNVSKYASVEYGKQVGKKYFATAITEKPERSKAKSDLAPLGRYVVKGGFFDMLHRIERGVGGEYQLTDALMLEIARGLIAYEFDGLRYDMGDTFGFLQANVEGALRDDGLKDKMQEYLKNLVKNF